GQGDVGIPVVVQPNSLGAQATYVNGRPVILVDPKVMANAPHIGKLWLIQHELGHHVLGHVDQGNQVRAFIDPSSNRPLERAADDYATRSLVAMGLADSLPQVAHWVRASGGISPSHPLPADRAAAIEKSVNTLTMELKAGDAKAAAKIEERDFG